MITVSDVTAILIVSVMIAFLTVSVIIVILIVSVVTALLTVSVILALSLVAGAAALPGCGKKEAAEKPTLKIPIRKQFFKYFQKKCNV